MTDSKITEALVRMRPIFERLADHFDAGLVNRAPGDEIRQAWRDAHDAALAAAPAPASPDPWPTTRPDYDRIADAVSTCRTIEQAVEWIREEGRRDLRAAPASPDERQAIDAGTHEPAVDDFGNQYLAPASPLPAFVNAFDYPCIEPMHKQAKRNLDAYRESLAPESRSVQRRKAIMRGEPMPTSPRLIAPKVPTGSHKPWCASLRYNMGYECNCRVANMLEGSHE